MIHYVDPVQNHELDIVCYIMMMMMNSFISNLLLNAFGFANVGNFNRNSNEKKCKLKHFKRLYLLYCFWHEKIVIRVSSAVRLHWYKI